MGSEGFFYTQSMDAVLDVLRPVLKLDDETERRVREAMGLLSDRDFTIETFLGGVVSGQSNSEVVTTATGGVTITFPQPFKTVPNVVPAIGDTATALTCNVVNASVTTESFDVQVWDTVGGTESNGTPVRITWIAS